MTVPQSVTGVLRAVVSAKAKAVERGSRKVAICRASLSIRAVKVVMAASEETTRATHGVGVTSAVLSARWATSSKATCSCVAIMA